MLEVFHALLRHLRLSVDTEPSQKESQKEEENFQEEIINTIGQWLAIYNIEVISEINYIKM